MRELFDSVATSVSLPVLLLLAKATLILGVALVAAVAMRKASARARHLVWLVTLGGLLALPALSSWGPLRVAILPASIAGSSNAQQPDPRLDAPSPTTDRVVAREGAALPPALPNPGADSAPTRAFRLSAVGAPAVLLALWAAVSLALALWLAHGAFAVHRIVRRATSLDAREWLNPLWEVSDRLALEEPPRLLASADVKMPFACGLLRPTIVFPVECEEWDLDRRRAVLLHELAHVRRRDLLGHTLGRLACALYWFHPLVWTAAKKLRSESERACDDLAITSGARASDYAEHLLEIVTGIRSHAMPAMALAMARRKEFEGRLLAILDPELRRSGPGARQSAILAGAIALLTIVGAAAPAPRTTAARAQPSSPSAHRLQEHADTSLAAVDQPVLLQERPERVAERSTPTPSAGADTARSKRARPSVTADTFGRDDEAAIDLTLDARSPTLEDLTAAAQRRGSAQGRGDDRPTLLANVLRTDSSVALRRVAAWGLAQFDEVDVAVEALATALRRDASAVVREMSAWALAHGGRRNTAAVEALSAAVRRDASSKVRATAAWALGSIGDEDAADVLAEALGDTSEAVRYRAAWALGHVDAESAPRALVALLSDREPKVRQVAAWALFNIRDPEAVPALDAALRRETDREVQGAFIRALAASGERSIDAIRRLLDSTDPDVRAMAVRALAGGRASGPWPWPWPDPRPHP